MSKKFTYKQMERLWRPKRAASKFDGGEVTIIGGSDLFHGAPILALRVASRVVDMVYLATPEQDKEVSNLIKAQLGAFIWIPRDDLSYYLKKSEAILIGTGMMRYGHEHEHESDHNGLVFDNVGKETKRITEELLTEYPLKKWVIDGGSLQVMDSGLIPIGSVVTPNAREYEMLFKEKVNWDNLDVLIKRVERQALRHECVIALKGALSIVSDGKKTYLVEGGSPGLAKGGTGDVLAGLTVGLLAKNPPLLAAAAANFLVKKAGEALEKERGTMFNADDVADAVARMWKKFT